MRQLIPSTVRIRAPTRESGLFDVISISLLNLSLLVAIPAGLSLVISRLFIAKANWKAQIHALHAKELQLEIDSTKKQNAIFQEQASRQYARIGSLEATEKLLKEQYQALNQQQTQLRHEEASMQRQLSDLLRERDTLAERYQNQTQTLAEKQQLLESSEQRLLKEFEQLAHKIFEQKSQTFRNVSESSLETLLKPFREQISGFQQQVNQKSEAAQSRHVLLQKELDELKKLNLRMSEEALNLTKALKGENKTQGNWGEVILQKLLDQAGLTEGREYETQVSLSSEQGKKFQPDIVVHLPQDKDIVVDSKVSLVAYERFVNSECELEQEQALQEHIRSVKGHIRELGKKNYHELKGLRTLDYVLLFIPIEAAFLAAIQKEPDLVRVGLDQNIMLVSPTNLMVALRTIHNIWQVEQQNRNAQEIADRASKLYDKFVGFVEDIDRIGVALNRADKEYLAARNKLETGSGNLIRQATLLQELGVRSNKQLDEERIEQARV